MKRIAGNGKCCLKLWRGDVHMLTGFCLVTAGAVATGGRLSHQAASCPSWKGLWLDGFLEFGLRSFGIALAEGLHVCGQLGVSLLNYTLAFNLQLRKNTENHSKSSRVVTDYSWSTWMPFEGQPPLACWASVHLGYPRRTSVSPWSAQVPSSCRNKGFPASADFESKRSVCALIWSAKYGIPKST
jgi:hypothetical protein